LIKWLVIDPANPLAKKNHEEFLALLTAPMLFEGRSPEIDAMIDIYRTNALENYHAGIEESFLPLLDRLLEKDVSSAGFPLTDPGASAKDHAPGSWPMTNRQTLPNRRSLRDFQFQAYGRTVLGQSSPSAATGTLRKSFCPRGILPFAEDRARRDCERPVIASAGSPRRNRPEQDMAIKRGRATEHTSMAILRWSLERQSGAIHDRTRPHHLCSLMRSSVAIPSRRRAHLYAALSVGFMPEGILTSNGSSSCCRGLCRMWLIAD
jgi:hypothetical protein